MADERPAIATELRGLIDAYWACAYTEGAEGRTHDDSDGSAQTIRSAIEDRIDALSLPTAPAEPVAFIERAVLDQLAKHKDATGTVASGLLKRPFGDPVPLYAAPPSPPYGRRQMARPDKTRVAIIAHVHPSKSNVATVVARALSAISDDRIASVYDIRIENPPDMPRFVAAPKEAEDDQT